MLVAPSAIRRYSTYMSRTASIHTDSTSHGFANGYLFGIPLGDLGLFATLLMSAAVGFGARRMRRHGSR